MAQLLDLPTEIQLKIFRLLCHHCTLVSQPNFDLCSILRHDPKPFTLKLNEEVSWKVGRDDYHMHRLDVHEFPPDLGADLEALSLTCRRVRNLAQPFLFHWIRDPPARKLPRLVSVLYARPELGMQVKIFHPEEWRRWENSKLCRADIELVRPMILSETWAPRLRQAGIPLPSEGDALLDLLLDFVIEPSEQGDSSSQEKPINPQANTILAWEKSIWDSLYFMLFRMIPNLEYLHCPHTALRRRSRRGGTTSDPEYQSIYGDSAACPIKYGIIMPKLKQIIVVGATPFSTLLSIAPRLESFTCGGFQPFSGELAPHGLKSIHLGFIGLRISSFRKMLHACPHLRSLCCHLSTLSYNPEVTTPCRVCAALRIRSDTLKELRLSFTNHVPRYKRAHREEFRLDGNLRRMRVLRVLQIRAVDLISAVTIDTSPIWHKEQSDPDYGYDADDGVDWPFRRTRWSGLQSLKRTQNYVDLLGSGDGNDADEVPPRLGINTIEDATEARQEDTNRIIDILPPSLESLTIIPHADRLLDALKTLARRAPVNVPNLRELWIWGFNRKVKADLLDEFSHSAVVLKGRPTSEAEKGWYFGHSV